MRSASTLVLAEHDGSALTAATLSTITAAFKLSPVTLLVTGSGLDKAAASASRVAGVCKVLVADAASLAHGSAENTAACLAATATSGKFTHVFAPASAFGKGISPRAAALLDVSALSEIMSVDGPDTFTRPMYAGSAIARVVSSDAVKVATVRPTSFEKAGESSTACAVEAVAAGPDLGLSSFVSEDKAKSDRPELGSARVVVAGGRGMKNGENFGLLYKLADKLGAGVGASRAAVDAGYVPNDMQIGQTGKVVAPELYIAVGISGAIQHMAGMKDSKTIVAINKDAEAPIFQVADYGLVEDLFKVVPEMQEKL